jgi:hypothetical protein
MFFVERAIKYAIKLNLTGLVFHCNDLLDRLILPSKYFTKDISLDRYPIRDGLLVNNNYYMHGILNKCKKAGLEFYAEVKELSFAPEILELFPHLLKNNGAVCPTDPFWWEFLEEKIRELFERLPEISGIIVSPGTRESQVSLAANGCVCERCKSYNIDRWYKELIGAMYRPIVRSGKRLIIRDFSYTKEHQFAMIDAAGSVSSDIIIAMKKCPHDYYPVFPDNPAVGNTGLLSQWIEFDTWGQYFGLGIFPCSIVEDMQGRIQRYFAKGAEGIMLRVDWEIILESSIFHSFNMVNLFAGAMLGYNIYTPLDDIYKAWLADGLFTPLKHNSINQIPCIPSGKDAPQVFRELMKHSWDAYSRLAYVRGHVFSESGVQPIDRFSLVHKMMIEMHGRDDWDPEASRKVEPTDENLELIFKEKDEGVAIVKSLRELIKPDDLGISDDIKKYLEFLLDMYEIYAEVMRKQAHTVFLTEKAKRSRKKEDIDAARSTLDDEYNKLSEYMFDQIRNTAYSPVVEWCLDGKRIMRFKKDVIKVLDELR